MIVASETYDYEPFGNTEHSMKQIADAIRHKGYGKDVREAIAEGIGQFDQVKGEVFQRVKAVEDDNTALNQRVDKLADDLSAEAQARKTGDDNEARDRRAADQALEEKISQSEERLTKRIAALEDMLFGQHPQEVKMAENSTPPVNGGAMLVNLTNEEDK